LQSAFESAREIANRAVSAWRRNKKYENNFIFSLLFKAAAKSFVRHSPHSQSAQSQMALEILAKQKLP
jgi:hypothetical protein